MPKYVYTGPRTAIAIPPKKDGEQPVDVPLIPNTQVELPADMPYVKRSVAKGTLTPVTAPQKASRSRNSKAEADS